VVTVDANGTLGRQQAATMSSVRNVQVAVDHIAMVTDAQFNALSTSVSTLSTRVDGLFDLTTTIDRDAQRGIASIAAQANPHFPSEAGKTSYASNVATYRGEVGFSAGLMHRLEGDFAITAGVTYAGGNSTSVRAGVAGEF
jgi:autotransporter adhesin